MIGKGVLVRSQRNWRMLVRSISVMKGDCAPVVRESVDVEAAVGKESTGYLMLDAGEEETKTGGRGLHELELVSRVGEG
jgi:hypothetical protein